ncbi:MAG: outer membrane beta-barrel protein [Acidobacteriota bacterium]
MKRISAICLALFSISATTALAGDDDDHHHHHGTEFTFTIGGGAFFGDTLDQGDSPIFDQGVDIDEAFVVEAGFGVKPLDWLEVGASASFTPTSFTVEGDSGLFGTNAKVTLADVDIWHYTADGRFHFLPRNEKFDPYALFGLGAATYRLDRGNIDVESVKTDTKFAVAIGSGFNVWFSRQVGMRFEAKDLVTVLDVSSDYDYECGCYYDYGSTSDTLNNVELTAGLTVRWH